MGPGRKRPFPLAHLLFVTGLVASAGLITGIPPLLAVLLALSLTLLLLIDSSHRRRRTPRSSPGTYELEGPGPDDRGPLPPAEGCEAWIGGYLPKLRAMRRRMRKEAGSQFVMKMRSSVNFAHDEKWSPREPGRGPGAVSGDDRASGLLLLLALQASLLTVLALISQASRFVEQDGRLHVFGLLELCGVVVLPFVVGLVFRCELHSILTMIALSAAIQTLLFQAVGAMPDGLFLGMAAITLPGIPLGLAWLFSRIDRRPEGGWFETTTGKLLESKQDRMSLRRRARVAAPAGDRPPPDPGAVDAGAFPLETRDTGTASPLTEAGYGGVLPGQSHAPSDTPPNPPLARGGVRNTPPSEGTRSRGAGERC
jgi:hypothetical protein